MKWQEKVKKNNNKVENKKRKMTVKKEMKVQYCSRYMGNNKRKGGEGAVLLPVKTMVKSNGRKRLHTVLLPVNWE